MEKTLHEKLVDIQQRLNVPKGQTNSFGGYKYRSCEDILEAVKPFLKEHGLSLILNDDVMNVGTHNYIRACATLTDDSNHEVRVFALAREAEDKKGMDDAQITGSASSYARKYALNGLFAIDDTKDADTMDNSKEAPKTAPQKPYQFTRKVQNGTEGLPCISCHAPAGKPHASTCPTLK